MSDFTELNLKHWDAAASTYNARGDNVYQVISAELRARLDWIGVDWISEDSETHINDTKTIRLLDYACGTGMISRSLHPYLTSTLGIDLSFSMIEQYNQTARNQNLYPREMCGVVGNLLSKIDPSPAHLQGREFYDFDIAVVGLGFHHFEDVDLAARRVGERLRKGGVLMVLDFVLGEEGGHHHHPHHGHGETSQPISMTRKEGDEQTTASANDEMQKIQATVAHHGFSESQMKDIFTQADCGLDFAYSIIERVITFKTAAKEMKRRVFVCRGTKE